MPETIKRIAIIAPAGKAPATRVNAGCELLNRHGIETIIMPHVFADNAGVEWLSGEVAGRVSDLHCCWRDDSIDLVMCVRGGSGSAQLLPYLDWDLLRSRQLPLIGYSDITALHLAMLKFKAGIPIAAPMCGKLTEALAGVESSITRKYLYHALETAVESLKLAEELNILKPGNATGNIIACNLTVLNTLCGTPYLPDFSDTILVLEDINEEPYKLDRSLTQLEQCGILTACKGIIFGSFTECGTGEEILAVQKKYTSMINGPVFASFPFGHTFPMISIRNGSPVTMTDNGSVILAIEQ
ncbi:MAG: LD-carboxypeptidase [Victivallaceae bacterium]|nr:LD-carboxypeptidase [Victivallaceae bacterium]